MRTNQAIFEELNCRLDMRGTCCALLLSDALLHHVVGKLPQLVRHVDFGAVNERIVTGNEKPLFGFLNPPIENSFEHR